MSLFVLTIGLYVFLFWLPVDWVLSSELHDLFRSSGHWVRRSVLVTLRLRVIGRDRYWLVQGRALWITPWRDVRCRGMHGVRPYYVDKEEALVARDSIEADVAEWLRRN